MNGFTVALVVLANALLLLNYAVADQRKPDEKLTAIGELESFDEKPGFEDVFDGLDGMRKRRAVPESQEHNDNQQPPGGGRGGRQNVFAAIRNRRSAQGQGQGQENGGQGQGQGGQDGQRGPPEGKGQGRGQGRSRN
ncbi:uncharacterized protein LOC125956341 [Anopheles darlingi]|uniref:uncharacterized protein LOC125956341 n=1 Tax=Anopheles darlingi TaxID=43151 RepID=UPI0021004EF3|nr:uncharacterized protein LOC125956341 [Anopheles darlingi]